MLRIQSHIPEQVRHLRVPPTDTPAALVSVRRLNEEELSFSLFLFLLICLFELRRAVTTNYHKLSGLKRQTPPPPPGPGGCESQRRVSAGPGSLLGPQGRILPASPSFWLLRAPWLMALSLQSWPLGALGHHPVSAGFLFLSHWPRGPP